MYKVSSASYDARYLAAVKTAALRRLHSQGYIKLAAPSRKAVGAGLGALAGLGAAAGLGHSGSFLNDLVAAGHDVAHGIGSSNVAAGDYDFLAQRAKDIANYQDEMNSILNRTQSMPGTEDFRLGQGGLNMSTSDDLMAEGRLTQLQNMINKAKAEAAERQGLLDISTRNFGATRSDLLNEVDAFRNAVGSAPGMAGLGLAGAGIGAGIGKALTPVAKKKRFGIF
jgi:hypothetical protein